MSCRLTTTLVALAVTTGSSFLSISAAETVTSEVSSYQQAHPAPDLKTALMQVWAHNADVQAARAKLAASNARVQSSKRARYNPELALAEERVGNEVTREIGLDYAIDWSGKRVAQEVTASAERDALQAQLVLTEQEIAVQFLQAVVRYHATREIAQRNHQRVQLMTQFAELADKRLRVGDINQIERDLAALAQQEAIAQLAEAESSLAEAEQQLRVVGIDEAMLPDIFVGELPAMTTPVSDEQFRRHPRVRRAQYDVAAAQSRVTQVDRERKPDPVLSWRTGSKEIDGERDTLQSIGISIPLPLFNSGGDEVKAAHADSDVAQAELTSLLRQLRAQIAQSASRYNALRRAQQLWRESPASHFTARANLLQKMWEAGELSTADYLVQLNQTIENDLRGRELQSQVRLSYLDWLNNSGEFFNWALFPADRVSDGH